MGWSFSSLHPRGSISKALKSWMWVVGVEVTMVLIFRNGAEPRGAGSSCSEPSRTQSLARWASGFPPHPPLLLPGGNQAATPTPMRSSALSCCGFNFSPTLQMPRDPGGSPEGPTDCSAPRTLGRGPCCRPGPGRPGLPWPVGETAAGTSDLNLWGMFQLRAGGSLCI